MRQALANFVVVSIDILNANYFVKQASLAVRYLLVLFYREVLLNPPPGSTFLMLASILGGSTLGIGNGP